jgi:ERCC4-type nuclease
VGIERCEVGNFVQKLQSGELEEQMIRCTRTYSTTTLLLEGFYGHVGQLLCTFKEGTNAFFRSHIYPRLRMDSMVAALIRMSEYGIEIIQSPNLEGSAVTIRLLHNQRTEAEGLATLFKKIRHNKMPVKYSSNPQVSKLLGLGNRIPERVAIELIEKFGSIWAILNSQDKDILEVKGVGKGLLEGIKKGVGKC